jgi:hypothetical protein
MNGGSLAMGARRRGTVALTLVLLAAAAGPLRAQLAVQGSGLVAMAEHRVDAGRGVEQASGTLVGLEGRLFVGTHVEVLAHFAGGNLTADSAGADDRDLGEAALRASVLTVPWLALHAGISVRSYGTRLVRQRWTALHVGGEARLAFVGGGVTGVLRAELLPSVSVSGLEHPNRAFTAGAGLEWRAGFVTLGLRYDLERYDFPRVAGFERKEQLSMLTAHVGLRLGRR